MSIPFLACNPENYKKGRAGKIKYIVMPTEIPAADTPITVASETKIWLGMILLANGTSHIVRMSSGSPAGITAVKLELGPVQILVHEDADGNWALSDPPPNKALELRH